MATTEYYHDLTDKVLNMYDDSASGSRPRTSGEGANLNMTEDQRRQSASSKKSLQHKAQIKEEDEGMERSRRSRED